MTQRIVTSLRSLALLGAVTLGLRKAAIETREPEPRRGSAVPGEAQDAWLFDGEQTNLSSGVYMLEEQYARVSGALSSLRGVLSSLSRVPELTEAAYEPPRDAPIPVDPVLFDEERAGIPVLTNVVAFEDDDLFAEHTFVLPRVPAHQDTLARVA
ncbi:hypothetical protein [Hyphomonas sp.]|uniref:hypothetical protein n=1 Tax=Hyphomonas sp. TaxID=87 RepID=UPI00391BE417